MAQLPLPHTPVVSPTTGETLSNFVPDGAKPDSIGIHVDATTLQFRHDCLKELTNKLSWAIGTFYNAPYSGRQTRVQQYVGRVARAILRDHGYPKGSS